MAILRKNNKEKYTTIPMHIIRDERLSLKDIGLLVSMLSLPDNWEFSENGLEVIFKNDGITSIRTGLKNLERLGYLSRIRVRGADGRVSGVDWILTDEPQSEKPHLENPSEEKPNEEKPPQYNTKESNTKESKTKGKKKESKTTFDQIFADYTSDEKTKELLGEWLKVRKAKRAALTDRAIKMNIEKLDSLAAESKMSVNEYLSEVIRKGWAAFYPIISYNKPKPYKPDEIVTIEGKQYIFKGGKYYEPNGSGIEVDPYKKSEWDFLG